MTADERKKRGEQSAVIVERLVRCGCSFARWAASERGEFLSRNQGAIQRSLRRTPGARGVTMERPAPIRGVRRLRCGSDEEP